MKFLKPIFLVAITLFFFGSCQKELTYENGISLGTLKKSNVSGQCLPATIVGIFKKDSVLTNLNYVDVQVDVTIAGTFDINTDTVNGYSFHKTGNVGSGTNTIRLYPSGKPLAVGTNTFTVTYGASTCSFDITVVSATTGAAIFTLGGAPGNCTTFAPAGTYAVGTALTAGNSVSFDVLVATAGTWSITTAANTSGFSFSGSGVFTNTGTQTVTLTGSGNPTTPGPNSFTPTAGASTCSFIINVTGTTPAQYSLTGGPAPGVCTGAIVSGTYVSGTALNVGDTVVLAVNVTGLGYYQITTNTANNISFSKTGQFTQLGPQTVTLTGTGNPNNTAVTSASFTASGVGVATASCIFTVNLTLPAGPPNTDYIPQTAGTNWSDRLVGGTAADTIFTLVTPRTTVQGTPAQTYQVFTFTDNTGTYDSTYHRKGAGKYYEYIYGSLGLDNPINKEVMLLDSTLAALSTWTINLGPNSAGGGTVLILNVKVNAQIMQKGASATIAGTTYNNIIKVTFTYLVNIGAGDTAIAAEDFWYAKGKGLVYDKQYDLPLPSTTIVERETTRAQVY